MSVSHVVVDGSNLATEGRTLPSLQQLDEAVRAFIEQYEPENLTVVVDASFPNRVDAAEKAAFEEAVINSELVTPPAGVIGRGDAFLLEIADRANAVVLSNDSFQEFHGQFAWLFDQGRLIGGKPVPHVGWVFMERAPVRGPLSRRSVSDAREAARKVAAAEKAAAKAGGPSAKAASTAPSRKAAASRRRSRAPDKPPLPVAPVVEAEGLAAAPGDGGRRRRGRGRATVTSEPAREAYNDLLPFIDFVAAHPVGSIVDGSVERFSSHGAYVIVEGTRCYLPLKNMADPPPRSARKLLKVGELHPFVIQAFDTPRRGVDLAIPGVVPLPTVEPELAPVTADASSTASETNDQPTEEERVAPAKKAARKKAASKRARKTTAKKAARKAPARKSTKKAARRSTAARKSAKKATKRTAKRATKRTAKRATKRTAKRATKRTAKRATKRTAKRATKRTAKRATKRGR